VCKIAYIVGSSYAYSRCSHLLTPPLLLAQGSLLMPLLLLHMTPVRWYYLQVAQRAGEIAQELGLMTKADQAQSDTSQTNATGGTWMNLNLFSRNGSDANNSSWLTSDELDDQQAAAALQKYQQLGMKETDEAELAAGPTLSLHPVDQTHTRMHSHKHNATEPERTRTQSRAERAGTGS